MKWNVVKMFDLAPFLFPTQMKTMAVPADHALLPAVGAVNSALSGLGEFMRSAVRKPPAVMEMAARDLAYSLARVYMGMQCKCMNIL